MKVQYFQMFTTRLDASDICSHLELAMLEDGWDYALVEDDAGVQTGYVAGDTRWKTLEDGSNPWGLVFMEPSERDWGYEKYPQFKHLAR